MTSLALALCAGLGVHWIVSAPPARPTSARRWRSRLDISDGLRRAGLDDVDGREFVAVIVAIGGVSFLLAFAVFGGLAPATALAGFAMSFPVAAYRHRRTVRRLTAQHAWPRMIEEIRVQTSALGRSIPNALFEVGSRGPAELQPAFEAAHREWLLTTDLPKTLAVLKDRLADPTADMACETLLVAHELGGVDLDRRLEALADDRQRDVQGRKDARSRQAGARFARVFVLLVPAGMALAGTSIGTGRSAYRTTTGQVVVMIAIGLVIACWSWAGRVMRLPEAERVFSG